ncbi:MAG: methyltransferase domain-containing protein [Jaaginema sp. PMC 1079.18]|nr:methyltransferase domain-containing protein [Jaaginema sp. PMC 1080.18]MEC4853639.1 methyltransferase domain-containing protein [Jaaginema sp. PMC 1079.18]MEC4868588.1 methyltransferase domain-containing protein [Jaaginema sp. PMC 1078.18]
MSITPFPSDSWQEYGTKVISRFEKQYQNKAFDVPEEVEDLPIYSEWKSGALTDKLTSPFWEIAQPKKNQRCLDIGCGVSFLIYPWRDWQGYFYGQEISKTAIEALNSRGSQLNSKLFKGVKSAPGHILDYEPNFFDLAIATGWSCYYPLDYWKQVMSSVKTVLKPDGFFVFDVLNPDHPDAEDWAVLEMYLGVEVFLESIAAWKALIKDCGAKAVKQQEGALFDLYKVRFGG